MQEFHDCPYCAQELEQWSVRFYRSDGAGARERQEVPASRWREPAREEAPSWQGTDGRSDEGLTLLSLCPSARCGYYVLRYRNGLTHWDRDIEAARLLRTLFSEE